MKKQYLTIGIFIISMLSCEKDDDNEKNDDKCNLTIEALAEQQEYPNCYPTNENGTHNDNIPFFGVGEVLYARSMYSDYTSATYSFEFATRDDIDCNVRNDWDIQYGNSGDLCNRNEIDVNMTGGDNSTIVDLGTKIDFCSLQNIPLDVNYTDHVFAAINHVYIIHTKDRDSDFYTKLIITNMKSNDWIKFNWERSDNGIDFNH